jgi:hypothetical protein
MAALATKVTMTVVRMAANIRRGIAESLSACSGLAFMTNAWLPSSNSESSAQSSLPVACPFFGLPNGGQHPYSASRNGTSFTVSSTPLIVGSEPRTLARVRRTDQNTSRSSRQIMNQRHVHCDSAERIKATFGDIPLWSQIAQGEHRLEPEVANLRYRPTNRAVQLAMFQYDVAPRF